MENYETNEEINYLREYLRIESVQPNVNYVPCVDFLKRQAENIGLDFNVCYPAKPDKPVVILTYQGKNPELTSIMLNSHMDVVPVSEEYWTHKPFAADIDENGIIYARGVQDMKGTAMQYLAALRYFKRNGIKFERTIHVTFVPDEEIGGQDGMEAFIETDDFKKLNVGFALDESGPFEKGGAFVALNGERAKWALHIKCVGKTGHGSIMEESTAAEKLLYVYNKFYEYRAQQMEILKTNPYNFGDTVGINATMINGGVQINVVPAEFVISFDIRIGPNVDHDEFEKMIRGWCKEAGDDVTLIFDAKSPHIECTKLDESNKYWIAMKNCVEEMGYKLLPFILPATSDARFVRAKGIPVIGFTPMCNIPILAHAHNEYLPADMFLKGIEVYKKIIQNIANLL